MQTYCIFFDFRSCLHDFLYHDMQIAAIPGWHLVLRETDVTASTVRSPASRQQSRRQVQATVSASYLKVELIANGHFKQAVPGRLADLGSVEDTHMIQCPQDNILVLVADAYRYG